MDPSAALHVGDSHFGEVLPVPRLAAIAGAAREPEDANLLPLPVPHDLGGDLGALHDRLARLDVLAVGGEQDAVEGHLAPWLGGEQGHLDRDTGFSAELLAAGREDGIRHRARTLIRTWGSVKATRPRTAR